MLTYALCTMLPKPMIVFFLTMPLDVRPVEPFIHIYFFYSYYRDFLP